MVMQLKEWTDMMSSCAGGKLQHSRFGSSFLNFAFSGYVVEKSDPVMMVDVFQWITW